MISGLSNSRFLTNQMNTTQNSLYKAQQQVSSGKRINSAADDAAGLAISNKLLASANSLKAYSSNYSSQIYSNNIAEGALSGVSDTYNDMYANSIRSMNGTMSSSDVAAIGQTNDALKATVDHISSTTKYNEDFVVDDIDTNWDSLSADDISTAAASASDTRSQLGAQTNALEHATSVNDISAENTTAALSRKEDAEMEKAISTYKNQQTISQFQNMLFKNQMSTADGIVTRMLGQ